MRRVRLFVLTGLVVLPVGATEMSPYATKLGQWEMKTFHNGRALPIVRTCVDETTAAQAEKTLADPKIPQDCKEISQDMKGEEMHFEYACGPEKQHTHVRGWSRRVSENAFESQIETLQNDQIKGTTTIAGQWLGACPAQAKNSIDIPGVGQMDMDKLGRMAKELGAAVGH